MKTGPANLTRWVEESGLKKLAFAKRVGASRSTLFKWMNGTQTPTLTARMMIQDATDGHVTLEDWEN